ncbi:putative MFS family arabinose efflux permease [Krasilnikovia cinnamomea]|uniref:Putative MFS family arabinose efflux permease n=1 Tax=Krasilnikovia cinnamomea TaxID=349313 RepID=A0A4Q7ZTG9_9ACTN|nr:MFS transporter [Krasilnikovia cinnamomea]RZU54530.1 putative MFS family arabinose efflux permease [Krasilnikovia cinnamomea]
MAATAGVLAPSSHQSWVSRHFPLVVFTLTFALMLSDYMSRQVLAAIFPYLKSDWGLTDTELGVLTSIVSLMVGVLAVPLSILGDRWGRARAIVAMAVLWSIATIGSALAAGYGQMFAARAVMGIGEAAYTSVGLAVVLSVFAPGRRAALSGTFMAGGSLGAVLGVALGGILSAQFGWRWTFAAMGVLGLVLAAMYAVLITDRDLSAHRVTDVGVAPRLRPGQRRAGLGTLFSKPSLVVAYFASGMQLFVAASIVVWVPSYLNRVHELAPRSAAGLASLLILVMSIGMITCGFIADRVSRNRPLRPWTAAAVFSVLSMAFLGAGFAMDPDGTQLLVLAVGFFFVGATNGPMGAVVAHLAHESIRATAFGFLTTSNNVLGLALGPIVTGMIADRMGLQSALQIIPLLALVPIVALVGGRLLFPADLRRMSADEGTGHRETAGPGGQSVPGGQR